MAGTRRLNQLREQMISRSRFPEGDLTVALSGGADSAALADLAVASGISTSALHVNHQWPASAELERAAAQVARDLGIELEVATVEVPNGPSPEAMAREARYEVFGKSDRSVLTGHTSDDNAETVLINLIRGTGISGLAGIPFHRPPNIWRPILELRRSETRELAALANLGFIDDPANSDPAFTRTQVRNQLLPALAEFNPRIVETLNQTAANLGKDVELIDSLVTDVSDQKTMPTSVLLTAPAALADRLVIRWLGANGVGVSSRIIGRVWTVVRGESTSQELSDGVVVRRNGAVVELGGVG